MTRQVHDQFAKQYLAELLAPFGDVEISREVTDEPRQIDVWFQRTTTTDAATQLGLLGRLAKKTCLLEPFRNQPSKSEVRNCLLKLFSLCADYQRQAKRERSSLPEVDLPQLWLLVTSASTPLLKSLGAKLRRKDWPTGVYFLATVTRSRVVVINQLPVTPETLWLRIMGLAGQRKSKQLLN